MFLTHNRLAKHEIMNVTLFFSVHVAAYMIGWAQSLDRRMSRAGSDPWPGMNWFIPVIGI